MANVLTAPVSMARKGKKPSEMQKRASQAVPGQSVSAQAGPGRTQPVSGRKSGMPETDCWADLFEDIYFGGRMRRLFGPQFVDLPLGKSLIVGPEAIVTLHVRSGSNRETIRVSQSTPIPEIGALIKGMKLVRWVK